MGLELDTRAARTALLTPFVHTGETLPALDAVPLVSLASCGAALFDSCC